MIYFKGHKMNFIQNSNIGLFEAFRRNFHFIQSQFNGAMAIAPYGFSLNPKHYNLTYLSQKIFFNVKMIKNFKKVNSL